MADVELVIKIPEECYKQIQKHIFSIAYDAIKTKEEKKQVEEKFNVVLAIKNGTPLPKGHNILDENKVVMELVYGNLLKDDVKCGDITSILKDARIVEADKESEE